MKTRHKVGIVFLATIVIVSITGLLVSRIRFGKTEPAQELRSDSPRGEQSTPGYLPPVFKQDDRRERILALADDFHAAFLENAERKHIPGVAYGVVLDGELVLDSALGSLDSEGLRQAGTRSYFRIASMSKSFTAMAIVKLRDEGRISLEDPVQSYIPEMTGSPQLTSDAAPIRIYNLLTMSAGFPEDNPWGDRQLDESPEMLHKLAAEGITPSTSTATGFEYSNTGYALLGDIISRVSGIPYQDYIRDEILLPLGMHHTFFEYSEIPEEELARGYRWEECGWKPEPILHDGAFACMGGLITTIEDFSRYVNFHLQAWPPRNDPDEGPVRRSSLREMHMAHFPDVETYEDLQGKSCASMTGYGYGLRIDRDCMGVLEISHGGALPGYGSKYYFYPDYGIGIMAFGNLTYTGPLPYDAIHRLIFREAGLEARSLPPSRILLQRQDEAALLIRLWNTVPEGEGGSDSIEVNGGPTEFEETLLAENFYMDRDREHRMKQARELLGKAGEITATREIVPENQLRGTFIMEGRKGNIHVRFTLSPEKEARIQSMELRYKAK